MGWRYFVITMGGVALIMFLIRFVAFSIFESPKFHMGKGRDEMAVKIVHEVARRNGRTSGLSIEDLRVCDGLQGGIGMETDNAAAIKRKLASLRGDHVRALFATRKLAFSTSMIMVVWAFIGLAFPLYVSFPNQLELMIERLPSQYPAISRTDQRRWINVYHLPKLLHHRRPRCPRGYARWSTRRAQAHRQKRDIISFNPLDWGIHPRLDNCAHLERTTRMELRILVLLERHVCGVVCLYPRDIPYER
jgi:hypothetical protein